MAAIKGLGQLYIQQEKNLFGWKYLDLPVFLRILDSYLESLGKPTSSLKVLDLGCGSGKLYPSLLDRGFVQENLYGIDVDVETLQLAKQEYPEAHFYSEDIRNLMKLDDLEGLTFDICITLHVLHLFTADELTAVLKNIACKMKPDGVLIALTAHPLRWIGRSNSSYFSRTPRNIITPWGTRLLVQQHTFSDYIMALSAAGLCLEMLTEPIPDEAGKAEPVNYLKYSTIPTRMLFVATKR